MQRIWALAVVAVVISLGLAGTLRVSAAGSATATQSGLQNISPSTCDYSTATDYFCTLPPGSTIKLPMSAPAVTPSPGWVCTAGDEPTQIIFNKQPDPTAGISVTWVKQSAGACSQVSGYAKVTVSPKARPQYLATDFFLGNDVGECQVSTGICTNGIADNGTRWSLNISLPQYVLKYSHQVVTSNFPNGTTPYVFPDYPPATGAPPQTDDATVTCSVSTKVIPAQNQFGYSGKVSCNSPNGIVGRIAFNVYRIWQDRTDSGGGVFLCSQQNYQSTCQTPTYNFQTYGNQPAVYKIAIDVNLLNPINGEGLPGNVVQTTGANYQMVPYNDTNTPYPLVNPKGWNDHHLPFPDIETLPSFTNCPTNLQGTVAQCSAYNTPLLRSNAITSYQLNGYEVPKGVTPASSGEYITQYIKPVECGGGTQGSNGAFLKPGQASQFSTWWGNFWPCGPLPPTVKWKSSSQNFTKHVGDGSLQLSVKSVSATATPQVSFSASYPGYTDPANPQNHWFTIANVATSNNGVYQYKWNLKTPSGQPVPAGKLTIKAVACGEPNNCTSSTISGQMRQRYFLFALGLSSKYDAANPDPAGFGKMQQQLLHTYPGSASNFYIYPCSGTTCNSASYSVLDTCTDSLNQDTAAMESQVQTYAKSHPDSDIYIVGDSLGGVTSLGYLARLNAEKWTGLPNGGKVKGVVTVDAPLGSIPQADETAVNLVFDFQCYGAPTGQRVNPIHELVSVPNPGGGFSGGTALLAPYLFPSSTPEGMSNNKLARQASRHGVHVLSVGNMQDFGFNFSASHCASILQKLGVVDFTDSQFLAEQAPRSVYSRSINVGEPSDSCAQDKANEFNHGVAMNDPNVIQGVANFVAGNAPVPLQPH